MMKNRERSLNIISTIFVIFLIVPLLLATYYAIPAADDFGNSDMILATSDNIFNSALQLTAKEYFSWQGTVSATFMLYVASPLIRGGILGIKLGCAVIVSMYIFSIYFLIFHVTRYIFDEHRL